MSARPQGLPFVMAVFAPWNRAGAEEHAGRLNATARRWPGAHPDRSYEVERGRLWSWRVVKYLDGGGS